jgi:hypothetical protein
MLMLIYSKSNRSACHLDLAMNTSDYSMQRLSKSNRICDGLVPNTDMYMHVNLPFIGHRLGEIILLNEGKPTPSHMGLVISHFVCIHTTHTNAY